MTQHNEIRRAGVGHAAAPFDSSQSPLLVELDGYGEEARRNSGRNAEIGVAVDRHTNASWPDRWHVGLTTTLRWATRDPVPSDRVADVLRAWGFELDQQTSFCHWRWVGPPPRTNPMRQQMSRVRELDHR